jgi:hypothetical protein
MSFTKDSGGVQPPFAQLQLRATRAKKENLCTSIPIKFLFVTQAR